MRLLALAAVPLLTVTALAGCSLVPRGPVVSEERDIDAATAVELGTSGELTISEGAPSLTVHAPQAVLDRLTATVEDGTLVLGATPGTPGILLGRISYELTLPSLERLEIDGSGDVRSDVPGDSLEVSLSGSGELDLSDIDADSVRVDISGSGDVRLAGRRRRTRRRPRRRAGHHRPRRRGRPRGRRLEDPRRVALGRGLGRVRRTSGDHAGHLGRRLGRAPLTVPLIERSRDPAERDPQRARSAAFARASRSRFCASRSFCSASRRACRAARTASSRG